MDFHFYNSSPAKDKNNVKIKKIFTVFSPLLLLAAILPILLVSISRPTNVRFGAEASQNELRVWIEPANSIVTHGNNVVLTVVGSFESDTLLLPGVTFPLSVEGPAAIESATVNYKTPFKGQVTLGTIKVFTQRAGKVTIHINKDQIVSPTFSGPLPVTVSDANITVK